MYLGLQVLRHVRSADRLDLTVVGPAVNEGGAADAADGAADRGITPHRNDHASLPDLGVDASLVD
jgi:hypothetical protein